MTKTLSTIAAMKAAPMFSALGDAAIRGLLSRCRTMRLAPEEMVFGPTQKAEQFYIIHRGQVKIYILSPRGDEQILHMFGPGDTFAEAAMWSGGRYPAFAQALSSTELIAIGKDDLRRAIVANPELALGMMAGLSLKLREFNSLIEELSLKEVPARIAGVLLKERAEAGSSIVRLRQTKRQLAAQIGTIAETLSRALAKMKSQGLIDVRGGEIEILDLGALEDLAENG